MSASRREPDKLDGDEVAAFLRAHPFWLAENPDLYRALQPPARVHGDNLTDHMAAMLRAERAHAAAMAARADDVLSAGRAAAGLAARVQAAVLALIAAADPAEAVAAELPGILGIDAASLCVEGFVWTARSLPTGAVKRLMGERDVVFREAPADAALLHGEAAELALQDVLVRVPGDGAPALLALVCRDRQGLNPTQGTGALAFLGRALAAALSR
jgi:uncharacterized protein YigA (DUF484 family)